MAVDPLIRTEVDITFNVNAETVFGDTLFVVGSVGPLGAWKPHGGLELKTDPAIYPRWCGGVRLQADSAATAIEYKFVIRRASGHVDWEVCYNRHVPDWKACASSPKAPDVPSFGNMNAGGAQVSVRVPREDSLASTCADSDSPRPSPRGLSSITLEGSLPRSRSPVAARQMQLWSAAYRTGKLYGQCEDAFFYSPRAAGVADGVGQMSQFARYGIDSAAFSNELMENVSLALAKEGGQDGTPCEQTRRAIAAAEASAKTFGASTITVLATDGNSIGASNLGDSGCAVLRPKPWGMETVERSREMSHDWNRPRQFTRIPPKLQRKCVNQCRKWDSVKDADHYSIVAQPGDLVLLYTDGLTDNLYWNEIIRMVDECLVPGHLLDPAAPKTEPSAIAEALGLAAQARSMDSEADCPFSKEARARGHDMQGGKMDDVTVVASWVVLEDQEQLLAEGTTVSCLDDPGQSRKQLF